MSSWDELRLQVTPGAGIVARSAAALLVVPASAEHHQPVLEQLVALVRGARPGTGRALTRKLAAIVASSEPEDVPDLALFAGLGDDDVAALVLGDTEVSAQTATGPVTLSGRDSLTWVDRVLQSPSRLVVGAAGGEAPSPMFLADLVEGVVPGGGALLEPRTGGGSVARAGRSVAGTATDIPIVASAGSVDEDGEANPPRVDTSKPVAAALPAPPDPPAPVGPAGPGGPAGSWAPPTPGWGPPPAGPPVPPAAPAAPPQAPPQAPPASPPSTPSSFGPYTDPMPLAPEQPQEQGYQEPPDLSVPPPRDQDFQVEPLADAEPEQREPLPVEPVPAAPVPDASQTDLVEGVYCKRGHFTDPDSQFCIVCGIGLYETKIKRKGIRPELGFLVFDDGSVFHLDHDYVLGRQPDVDDEVRAGTVRGLRLEDSGGTVSRAHAIVRLIGWNVTIADRKPQNGTLVAAKGSDQFVPVSRDEPITLVPGSRIQLGQRTLVYESQRGRS